MSTIPVNTGQLVTPPPPPRSGSAAELLKLTGLAKVVTHDLQKGAALTMGFLTAFGVVPAAGGKLAGTAVFTGYAALVHVVETWKGASSGTGA